MFVRREVDWMAFTSYIKSLPCDSMSERSYVKTDPSAESKSCNLLLLVVH